jgi:hypothetical protein
LYDDVLYCTTRLVPKMNQKSQASDWMRRVEWIGRNYLLDSVITNAMSIKDCSHRI